MQNNKKTQKKLTQQDRKKMWGEDGPYSQVRLCEEIRILDDSVSRVFLVVEAEINPFTFEYIRKNRQRFLNDEPILQLLDHAEYRGEFGYVVGAGEVELGDEESKKFARKQADITTQTLIRMHKFIIDEFGLQKENKFGIIRDNEPLVWNENFGGVQKIDNGLWGGETLIGSPSGVKNNKMRSFFVLAFTTSFDFKKQTVFTCMENLMRVSSNFRVEIEDCESFHEYMLITTLLPMDVAPADFIEKVIDEVNKNIKKFLFLKDYFVSNVKKPDQQLIMDFLGNLPSSKNTIRRK